jgi:hypothetical protein
MRRRISEIQVLAKLFHPPSVQWRGDDEPRDCIEVDVTGWLRGGRSEFLVDAGGNQDLLIEHAQQIETTDAREAQNGEVSETTINDVRGRRSFADPRGIPRRRSERESRGPPKCSETRTGPCPQDGPPDPASGAPHERAPPRVPGETPARSDGLRPTRYRGSRLARFTPCIILVVDAPRSFVCASPTSRLHRLTIDVVNVNDWRVVEPRTISTFTTTSVPAVS